MKFSSKNISETREIALKLGEKLPRGTTVLLEGDLGAGKTAFTRGFVSRWGLEDLVSSPTFTVMNEYRNEEICIYHFDLYRLSSPEELVELGLDEFLETGDYSLIEWPGIAQDWLPGKTVQVSLRLGQDENERIIEIEGA